MEWGLLIVGLVVVLIAYAILQETRAQRHWRGLAAEGDVDAIRKMLETEVSRWRTERVPKGTDTALWHNVQTVELIDVGPDSCRVTCSAEGQYALASGLRRESSSPLREGMKVTRRLADMVLYDIPNLRLDRVQVDVYTTFRDEAGQASQRCILSTVVDRALGEEIDWDEAGEEQFVRHFGGRFSQASDGATHPIDPDEELHSAPTANGARPGRAL